jgi:hypothetical protein
MEVCEMKKWFWKVGLVFAMVMMVSCLTIKRSEAYYGGLYGGMYGGWNWIAYSQIATGIAAILSRRTARPVKWMFNRREDFVFGQPTP